MPAKLPYLIAPGSLKTALERIRAAATPERFTVDFVQSTLNMKGGAGKAIPPIFKRIGLVASDGSPTDLDRRFRNQTTGDKALGEAVLIGYRELAAVNESFYKLGEKDLRALIVQVTGIDHDNRVVQAILGTLRVLLGFAKFEEATKIEALPSAPTPPSRAEDEELRPRFSVPMTGIGMNLAYTINLNLPATTDQAVFNAIFRSLKEHLLSGNE